MIISANEIIEAQRALGVYTVLIADRVYYAPSVDDVNILLETTRLDQYEFIPEKCDCDNYALLLHAFIAQSACTGKHTHQWALGKAWGVFNDVPHAMNIVFCNDKQFRLVEPQTDEIRQVNPNTDNITYINI